MTSLPLNISVTHLEKTTSLETLTVLNSMPKSRMSSLNSQPNPNVYYLTSQKKKGNPYKTLEKMTAHVLTAGKGVTLVIIDKDTYIEKCMALLNDEEVYHECRDQTKSIHFKVVKQLLDLEKLHWTRIEGSIHQTPCSSSNSLSPRFYSLLKFVKPISPPDL